ncbi:MAG: MBOAT family protein [Bacteroidales bacterium]|nr:MBOAT family protein [Bacteroidales bacterium]
MDLFLSYLASLFAFDSDRPLLFTQFNFWAFFLLVFVLFAIIVAPRRTNTPRSARCRRLFRNGYLALVSILFYYKTSGLFVVLLLLTALTGWLLGIALDRWRSGNAGTEAPHSSAGRKALAALGICFNLFVLCYFKYAYFFTDIYNTVFHTNVEVVNLFARWANHFTSSPRFDAGIILLPVGISFFTFQNISYIVDVYKGKVHHAANLIDFAFYTTFFPQLVAGPIIRADQFVPQLYKPFFLSRKQFGIAVFWILNGLVKKIVLSDYLAVNFVDRVFDNPMLFTPFENFSALLVYSLQVYADFSGYTDIAIGVAMLMGFYLPTNFNSPYKATNPAGFWKRWHISLSNWLKDYLYIPLGGNRHGSWASRIILAAILLIVALMANNRWVYLAVSSLAAILILVYLILPAHRRTFDTNLNNMDTMLLGGLWHGASFNFITWGGLNGLGILVYKVWRTMRTLPRIVTVAVVALLCCVADAIFPSPLLSMLSFAMVVVAVAVTLLSLLGLKAGARRAAWVRTLTMVWNTLLTFMFISFTRLFFRSGSNLNPAEANEVAWRTASQMVHQIGSTWNLAQVPAVVSNYSAVFILFAFGMAVHWLPARFKRRYRLWFASMPLWLMAVVTVAVVFLLYQFITADLQPFIYFQF